VPPAAPGTRAPPPPRARAAPVPLHAREFGGGPALLVLHGLLASGRCWAPFARRLADHFRLHLLDLRNHGDSPRARPMGYRELAADVRRYLAARGLAPRTRAGADDGHGTAHGADRDAPAPTLLGHSLGGKTAMRLALESPALVGALVIVDVAPVDYPAELAAWSTGASRLDADALREAMRASGVPPAAATPLDALGLVDACFDWRADLAAIAADFERLCGFEPPGAGARFEGPALFVAGGASPYLRPEHREAVARCFPAARHVVIPGAGHWLHADAPRRLEETLRAFLAERGPAAPAPAV